MPLIGRSRDRLLFGCESGYSGAFQRGAGVSFGYLKHGMGSRCIVQAFKISLTGRS